MVETYDEEDQESLPHSFIKPEPAEEKDCEIQEVAQEDEEPLLTEDAYSLLYTARFCSKTSLFAWFSITLQGGMLLVTFLDLFDTSREGNKTNGSINRMEIPAGSTIEVMIAQFLGMLLTAMVMAAEGDFVIGITQLIKGYDPKIQQQSPNCTWCRWLMTGLLQSFFGLLLLFDSFILSMQSSTVIDLSLNLTALHFIQEIDNMSFALGLESGLLGPEVQADCEHVKNLKSYSTKRERNKRLILRRCLILLMTVGLLVPYFLVVTRQWDGHYMCKNLYIQFGDEYTPDMAHYSGMFRSQGNALKNRKGQRNYYVDDSNTFKLSYCDSENFWGVSKLEDHACTDYIFRSAETETFDIIEAAEENWMVRTESTGDISLDWLAIVCSDCSEDTCLPEYGVCSPAKDRCICHRGKYDLRRFGVNCQFEEDCYFFALDQKTSDGLEAIPGTSSFLDREYTSIYFNETPWATPTFYDRPIFVPYDSTTLKEKSEVDSFIIFTGRRWALFAIPDENLARVVNIEGKPSNWSTYGFETYFDDLQTSYQTDVEALEHLTSELYNYFPIFFSSPVNYGENSFGYDLTSVTWSLATTPYNFSNPIMRAHTDEQQKVAARFICSGCFLDEECQNNGYCSGSDEENESAGICVCETYYSGFLCERARDCISAGGCSGGEGTCNSESGTCECNEGSFGSLCQLGEGSKHVADPFLCPLCKLWQHGSCDSIFSQECTCNEGYEGIYCNETSADGNLMLADGAEELPSRLTNATSGNRTLQP